MNIIRAQEYGRSVSIPSESEEAKASCSYSER